MTTEIPAPIKPLLRGWLHLISFFLAVPAAAVVIASAETGRARLAAVIYGIGLVGVFGVSAMYHRGRWGEVSKRRWGRADHATIFVMIAGTYTPFCLVALDGWTANVMLVVAWSGAAAGIVLALRKGDAARRAKGVLYMALGWSIVIVLPELAGRLDAPDLWLLMAGGLLFSLGAIAFALRWPDPFPRHFGYHEVWHVFVVAAAACQLVAVSSVISQAGSGGGA